MKSKFVNNYRAYVRMKNNIMIKTQHSCLYTLPKEWFRESVWKIRQGSLDKKTELNFLAIFVSKNKQYKQILFIFSI